MSNLLSLAALTALAAATFEANPTVDKVFATADGNIFLPHNLNLARHHARQEKLEVQEITRAGATTNDVLEHIRTDAEANEVKHQADAADAQDNSPANVPPATTPAVPVDAAAAAQAAGQADATEKTGQVADKPATDGDAQAKAAADGKPKGGAKAKTAAANA